MRLTAATLRPSSPANLGYFFLVFFAGFLVSLLMSFLPLAAISKSSLWNKG